MATESLLHDFISYWRADEGVEKAPWVQAAEMVELEESTEELRNYIFTKKEDESSVALKAIVFGDDLVEVVFRGVYYEGAQGFYQFLEAFGKWLNTEIPTV